MAQAEVSNALFAVLLVLVAVLGISVTWLTLSSRTAPSEPQILQLPKNPASVRLTLIPPPNESANESASAEVSP